MKVIKLILSLVLVSSMACAMERDAAKKQYTPEHAQYQSTKNVPVLCDPISLYRHPVYKYILEKSGHGSIKIAQEIMKKFAKGTAEGLSFFEEIEKNESFKQLSPALKGLMYSIKNQCLKDGGADKTRYYNLIEFLNQSNGFLYNLPQKSTFNLLSLFDKVWLSHMKNQQINVIPEGSVELRIVKSTPEEDKVAFNNLPRRIQDILLALVEEKTETKKKSKKLKLKLKLKRVLLLKKLGI